MRSPATRSVDIFVAYMLAMMVFHDSSRDIMMMDQKVKSVIFAPFLVVLTYFVHRSVICIGRSIPSVNLMDLSAFSAPMATSSDIMPYTLVSDFQVSAAVLSILTPNLTKFLQFYMTNPSAHASHKSYLALVRLLEDQLIVSESFHFIGVAEDPAPDFRIVPSR